ncbi:hypothetical protein 65p108 [Aeromonas phage 65]|uniref:Uncharacterized protein n=2 Tax=Ishigurovirus osborne TaxID=260149 RepID=A0A219YC18_9CAUD|nr:hypothetical protein ST65p108 [Aeromonas phage 65]ADQ53116.1 hypothetical protein 65p108 [Aeromonas phage 65]APU01495.1 hypothetical protein [Aeromonas phage 65.2]
MYYKFKNEETIQEFNKSNINSEANHKISKIIGNSIFKVKKMDVRGQIVDIEGTNLNETLHPIFNGDEVSEFLEEVTFLESEKSDNHVINSVKNELLVMRQRLLDQTFRIDELLNKMENM